MNIIKVDDEQKEVLMCALIEYNAYLRRSIQTIVKQSKFYGQIRELNILKRDLGICESLTLPVMCCKKEVNNEDNQ